MSGTEILRSFNSKVCPCGNPKKSGHSFCLHCFSALPWRRREFLQKGFKQGYEEQFKAALIELNLAEPTILPS